MILVVKDFDSKRIEIGSNMKFTLNNAVEIITSAEVYKQAILMEDRNYGIEEYFNAFFPAVDFGKFEGDTEEAKALDRLYDFSKEIPQPFKSLVGVLVYFLCDLNGKYLGILEEGTTDEEFLAMLDYVTSLLDVPAWLSVSIGARHKLQVNMAVKDTQRVYDRYLNKIDVVTEVVKEVVKETLVITTPPMQQNNNYNITVPNSGETRVVMGDFSDRFQSVPAYETDEQKLERLNQKKEDLRNSDIPMGEKIEKLMELNREISELEKAMEEGNIERLATERVESDEIASNHQSVIENIKMKEEQEKRLREDENEQEAEEEVQEAEEEDEDVIDFDNLDAEEDGDEFVEKQESETLEILEGM